MASVHRCACLLAAVLLLVVSCGSPPHDDKAARSAARASLDAQMLNGAASCGWDAPEYDCMQLAEGSKKRTVEWVESDRAEVCAYGERRVGDLDQRLNTRTYSWEPAGQFRSCVHVEWDGEEWEPTAEPDLEVKCRGEWAGWPSGDCW